MKFVHTCYRVKNLEESVKFYQDAFGFEVKKRADFPEHKFTLVYLCLPNDTNELELTYNYDHPGYELGNGYGHIAIAVEALEEVHAKHKEAGYEVTKLMGLPGTEPGYYFVADPDGYKIEVIRSGFLD